MYHDFGFLSLSFSIYFKNDIYIYNTYIYVDISICIDIYSTSKSPWSSAISSPLWTIAACKHQKKAQRQQPGCEKRGISRS